MKKDRSAALGQKILAFSERIFGEQYYRGGKASVEMELLYPGKQGQAALRDHYAAIIQKGLLVLLAGIFLIIATVISGKQDQANGVLERNGYGKAEQFIDMTAQKEDGEKTQLTVTVSPRVFSEEEAARELNRVRDSLESIILGDNDSLDKVQYDLNLITESEPGPVKISWTSGNYQVMDGYGHITADTIPEEGLCIHLTALISYGSQSVDYGRMITIYPKPMSEAAIFRSHLKQAVEKADEESKQEEMMTLPSEVDGVPLFWEETPSHTLLILVTLTVLLMAGVYWNEEQKLHQQLTERSRQMEADYADILNKMVLLLGAGMTVKNAWERIAGDYRRLSGEKRYAYEEMLLSVNEMKSGISEMEVYEHFGRRCGSASYLKFSALLVQNLRKGSKGLLEVFRRESREAFEARKSRARRKGEEAGTKLLIPMFLMLVVVLVIVMVPAFLSMQM